MKTLSTTLFLLGLSFCLGLVNTAEAQRSGSRTNTLVSLAGYEAVHKELGIGSELAGKLNELGDEYRNASQKEFTTLGIDFTAISDLPALERTAEMRKVTEKTAEVNRKLMAKFQPKLEELLSSEQMERLKQIQLQAAGIEVWTEAVWAKELDLSEVQKAQLAELRNEYRRRVDQLDGDFTVRITKTREINTERDKKGMDVLNDGQKAKLEELKGKAFDVSQLGFRRRGNK